MSPQEKILDRLAKLKAAAEGEAKVGNAEAADAFATAINRLLLQHELSEADIPLNVVKEEPIVELLVNAGQFGIEFRRMRCGWQEALARIVAEAHLCKYLVTSGTNNITFVGTLAHVTVAEYAYGVLASAADRMSMAAREEWWKDECGGRHLASGNFRAAWLMGFVERIAQRFLEARVVEVRAAANSSQALMRLDNALVRVQAYIGEKYKKKAPATAMRGGSSAGREAGRKAADAMPLGQKGIRTSTHKRIT